MGSSVSVQVAPTANKFLTHEEFQSSLGSQYSAAFYAALHDDKGLVSRQTLELLSGDPIEREVLSIYLQYCPSGRMDLSHFLKFCVETKLLSKRFFSRKDAEVLFDKVLNEKRRSVHEDLQEINYSDLRTQILLQMASLQHQSPYQLMQKISFSDYQETDNFLQSGGPTQLSSRKAEPSRPIPQSASSVVQSVPKGGENSIVGEKLLALNADQAELVRKACIQLQKLTRSALAAKEAEARKERRKLSTASNKHLPLIDFGQLPSTVEEKSCHDLFLHFSTGEEMSLLEFYNFCYYTSLVPSSSALIAKTNFTRADAQRLFQKTMALYYDPSTKTYFEGVKFGKRILYPVFRAVVLPEIATIKHLSMDDLLKQLHLSRKKLSSEVDDNLSAVNQQLE